MKKSQYQPIPKAIEGDRSDDDAPSIYREENIIYFYDELDRTSIYFLKQGLKDIVKERYSEAHIVISSYGGQPLSIYEFIKGLPIPVYTYIDGYCASAAVILFLAGEQRFISPTATLLIHSARILGGNEEDAKQGNSFDTYDYLRKSNEVVQKQILQRETKIPSKELDDMLNYQERWLTPEECIKYKIADHIGVFVGLPNNFAYIIEAEKKKIPIKKKKVIVDKTKKEVVEKKEEKKSVVKKTNKKIVEEKKEE